MKQKNIYTFLYFFCLCGSILWLASCRSSRQAVTVPTDAATQQVMKRVYANQLSSPVLSAKMKLRVEAAGHNVSVGGSIKMERDKMIQISLVALGLIEAGRVEITPDYVLVVDRIGNRYVRESYRDIAFLREAGIDFYMAQALFRNEIFVPGKADPLPISAFRTTEAGKSVVLEARDTRHITLKFVVGLLDGLIKQTQVQQAGTFSGAQLNWRNLDFTEVDGKPVPNQVQVSVDGLKGKYQANFTYSNFKTDGKPLVPTQVNTQRYQKVSAESIFKRLMSL